MTHSYLEPLKTSKKNDEEIPTIEDTTENQNHVETFY